jgi:hypothetical protein
MSIFRYVVLIVECERVHSTIRIELTSPMSGSKLSDGTVQFLVQSLFHCCSLRVSWVSTSVVLHAYAGSFGGFPMEFLAGNYDMTLIALHKGVAASEPNTYIAH